MPKELTTEVVRGCLYTWMLIGRLDGRTPPEIMLITSHSANVANMYSCE